MPTTFLVFRKRTIRLLTYYLGTGCHFIIEVGALFCFYDDIILGNTACKAVSATLSIGSRHSNRGHILYISHRLQLCVQVICGYKYWVRSFIVVDSGLRTSLLTMDSRFSMTLNSLCQSSPFLKKKRISWWSLKYDSSSMGRSFVFALHNELEWTLFLIFWKSINWIHPEFPLAMIYARSMQPYFPPALKSKSNQRVFCSTRNFGQFPNRGNM
jgi:hypothetical protein